MLAASSRPTATVGARRQPLRPALDFADTTRRQPQLAPVGTRRRRASGLLLARAVPRRCGQPPCSKRRWGRTRGHTVGGRNHHHSSLCLWGHWPAAWRAAVRRAPRVFRTSGSPHKHAACMPRGPACAPARAAELPTRTCMHECTVQSAKCRMRSCCVRGLRMAPSIANRVWPSWGMGAPRGTHLAAVFRAAGVAEPTNTHKCTQK